MRSVVLILLGLAIWPIAQASEDPNRAALIPQIEGEYSASSVVSADSPIVEMMISGARPLNPNAGDATWSEVRGEVAAAITAALTQPGAALDVLLRGALEPLSTAELKRLSKLLSDPVYRKFQGSVSSAENQKRLLQTVMANTGSLLLSVNAVLERRGLKVPH